MKKPLLFLALLGSIFYFSSCQKELSTETGSTPSEGSLQSDVTGDCLPKSVGGIYEAGKVLNGSTNYIEVQVNVTAAGAYVIGTDTTNGIFFRSVGVFTATGLQTVRLKGNGTPATAGTFNYVVSYNTTQCAVAVTVLAAGGANPAVLQLAGAPNACMVANVNGAYVVGTALTIANTVEIGVNVTTAGTYNITTPVSNGIIFSGQGVVAAGATTIILTGSGTPAVAGTTNVVVTVGTSTCSFPITVISNAVPAGDYFPLTANSWWSYDDPNSYWVPGDSLTRLNINQVGYNGNTYRLFQNQNETTPKDSSYYRKAGNDYFELTVADWYSVYTFDALTIDDILFLKEGLITGQTWDSKEYSGTFGGVPLKIKYSFNCTTANGTANINGKTFTNVYKISWKPMVSLSGAPYQADAVSYESWYAKGVGQIYFKGTSPLGNFQISIKNYKVF